MIFWQDQLTPELFSGSVANQGGYYLNINNPTFITAASNSGTPSARRLQSIIREHAQHAEGLA